MNGPEPVAATEASPEDVAEQRRGIDVDDDELDAPGPVGMPNDADPADVIDQRTDVGQDDEDDRLPPE
ncbi:MAG TPA: hypothetical protein VJX10_15135 [Pseudonocardiaceae bacterium]|nr:hypothetical protein [Pseudonocardiaceae bacterium]